MTKIKLNIITLMLHLTICFDNSSKLINHMYVSVVSSKWYGGQDGGGGTLDLIKRIGSFILYIVWDCPILRCQNLNITRLILYQSGHFITNTRRSSSCNSFLFIITYERWRRRPWLIVIITTKALQVHTRYNSVIYPRP